MYYARAERADPGGSGGRRRPAPFALRTRSLPSRSGLTRLGRWNPESPFRSRAVDRGAAVAALLLGGAARPAAAQIYRCENANGVVEYSNSPASSQDTSSRPAPARDHDDPGAEAAAGRPARQRRAAGGQGGAGAAAPAGFPRVEPARRRRATTTAGAFSRTNCARKRASSPTCGASTTTASPSAAATSATSSVSGPRGAPQGRDRPIRKQGGVAASRSSAASSD